MAKEKDIPPERFENTNSNSEEVNETGLSTGQAGSQDQIIELSTFNLEPSTSNLEPQSSNMEVHHHPDLHHKKKHLKEYFLEFLMIFLAVTMGFLAESYREYLGDRTKEKEYMNSMIDDLSGDTLTLNFVIPANNLTFNGCDSLINVLSGSLNNNESILNAYSLYAKYTCTYYNMVFSTFTTSQLKNNGGFRLIKNNKVIGAINEFDGWINLLDNEINDLKENFNSIQNNNGRRVFDTRFTGKLLDSANMNATSGDIITFLPLSNIKAIISDKSMHLITSDKETLSGLCNDVGNYQKEVAPYLYSLNDQKKSIGFDKSY